MEAISGAHLTHQKKRKERGGKASPFPFLIDTIISINTIGFLGTLAKYLF